MKDEIIKFISYARIRMLDVWNPNGFVTKRYKLHAKCMGIVSADRIESQIFNREKGNE